MYVYENYGKMDYSIKCRLSLDINNFAKMVAKGLIMELTELQRLYQRTN